jgi:hypothetical protein
MRRWEYVIKMGHKEIWCEGADWVYLAKDREHW